ncbi:FHA domain-containing protein [Leucobacter iarius]|uniref:FHA domain-containing protein n=1 Tax=Leucobacter iarius TaxID=333963 RepID=A0ABN2LBZ7_9MICO
MSAAEPAPPGAPVPQDPRLRQVPPPRFSEPADSTVPLVLPGPPISVVLGPAPRKGAAAAAPERAEAPVPAPAPAPEAAPVPVAEPEPTPRTSVPTPEPPPAPPAVETAIEPTTVPAAPEVPAAPAHAPAPAPAAPAVPATPAVPAAPARPAAPVPRPVSELALDDDDLELTIVVPRGALLTDWNLVDRDGTAFRLHRSNVLGRRPSGAGAPEHAQLVLLSDPDRVLSRTHALLEVIDDEVWVTDLHSTNGSAVREPGQPARRLEPGTRVRVLLGSVLSFGGRAVSFAYDGHGRRA